MIRRGAAVVALVLLAVPCVVSCGLLIGDTLDVTLRPDAIADGGGLDGPPPRPGQSCIFDRSRFDDGCAFAP